MTEYYDDLLKLTARLGVPGDQLLCIFFDGLPEVTKHHIAFSANIPQNLEAALDMAKTFQTVTNNPVPPVKALLTKIKEDSHPLTASIQHHDSHNFKNINNQIQQMSDKLDKLTIQPPDKLEAKIYNDKIQHNDTHNFKNINAQIQQM